jgi:hypothetical protein
MRKVPVNNKEAAKRIPDTKDAYKQSMVHPKIESDQDTAFQNIQNLVKKNIYLKQITENVDQVIWVQSIQSKQILYVSPAYEKVWPPRFKTCLTIHYPWLKVFIRRTAFKCW